ncbi:SDR family NAD(P)-dependent oxidoreductase [Aspergillus mulundensis]|uniref:NADP(+)-dependent dehydrogenase n=1 Tax=Aspergillus mulundensis TaxID=1810919 RepID=A0A3D8QMS9_9EURO|nr:Uncharacterized protein DSM5745_10254 [Aspergillus mulundensis]RDW63143.1 Uncharacterized protein DSM5745_10254 [Aspergillus mulundensis]
MQPPMPSMTAKWHNQSYPGIDPKRPELSAAGKTVIITGAGSGIGRATALSFASAGAARIVLIGRDESKLKQTQEALPRHLQTSIHAASVTDEDAITGVATEVGSWDVLVLAAGYLADQMPLKDTAVDEWWQSFETNVKGTMIPAKAFLPTAASGAAIIGLTTAIPFPAAVGKGLSGYITSKLAVARILEYIAAENPGVFTAALNPGTVHTAMFDKLGADPGQQAFDSVDLPADFMVWLTSKEASFLSGRVVFANWDVEELKARAQEIQDGLMLTTGVLGWPFSPSDSQ